MNVFSPSSRRFIAWATGPCLPAWIVLAVLAAIGRLSWVDALIGAVLILALVAAFTLNRLADFDRLIRYAESLLENPETPPPELTHSTTATRMLSAITALRRLWTTRRDQAETLARSRQNIIDGLPDPLLLLDTRRRVRGANAAARELFALDAIVLPSPYVPGSARIVADRDLASIIRDPKVLEAVDIARTQNHATDAQLFLSAPVERIYRVLVVPLSHVPLSQPDEESAMIIAMTDQTELLKIERMRVDFVANASHELRTPLAAVLGFIETLQGPARDDEKARIEFLDIMYKQASRMTRLIDDLLSLSRIEMREHTKPSEPVDIALTLRSTVELLQAEAARRGTHLNIIIAPDLPPALGDQGELSQVFSNLLANAIKYGGDKGRVEVNAALSAQRPMTMPGSGPCITLAVRDYGEGIPREHIPRLTERFYRVDTARSRSLGGTGLGLAIVKHITSRHRGALTIDSTEGQGSTFTVWLPIAPARI